MWFHQINLKDISPLLGRIWYFIGHPHYRDLHNEFIQNSVLLCSCYLESCDYRQHLWNETKIVMVNTTGDEMLQFHPNPSLNPREIGAVSGVYFAGFVFCYTERFVFVDQGTYWSAVRSTVWAALQAGVGGRCLGLGDLDPPLNLSPAAAHYCAVEAGRCREPRESQKIISVHCKLSNPVTSMVMTYEHPQRIPMSNLKPIWIITRC